MRRSASFVGLHPASDRASRAARASSKKAATQPEVLLRRALTALGLRYRLTSSTRLTGKPDVVFPGARVVVFVDGDFWHGRDLEERLKKLARGHNAPYWMEKIRSNVARDVRVTAALEADGWTVVRLWESDVRADAAAAANAVLGACKPRDL